MKLSLIPDLLSSLNELLTDETHFIIDKNVADLYAKNLSKILQDSKTIIRGNRGKQSHRQYDLAF